MKSCNICGVSEDKVRIFDAIYNGKMANLCERCSIIENIPIIKRPSTKQLNEAEARFSSRPRLTPRVSIQNIQKTNTFFQRDRLKELDDKPELELPEKESLNLINHFHWEIMKNRRRKGLSHRQLAKSLGESELVIQMIEKAKLPSNPEALIRKIEQFFQISLRNIPKHFTIKQPEPILLDEKGQEIHTIPEEEMVFIDKEIEDKEETEKSTKEGRNFLNHQEDLDLRKIDTTRTTIGDLQRTHKKRIEVTKQERIEEQKKIEERQKILLALRERDRLKIEERRKQELIKKQKEEAEKQKLIGERKQELERRKKKRSEEIDELLGGDELI